MTDPRSSKPKVKAATSRQSGSEPPDRGMSAGRRPGRNTTFEAEAYRDEEPIRPQDLMDPDSTGSAQIAEEGYYQPTAMLDKGELLGELAQLAEVPDTRAAVHAEPLLPRGCRLIVVAGPDLGLEWAFKQPEIVIGRDEDCELQMADIAVSRRHAKIALEGERFYISDFGSGNGTYLNGVRVEREQLASGDEIVIGERTLRFVELNEAPPTAAAHPVPPLAAEPQIGNVPKAVGSAAREPALGKSSQVDVGVVPKVEGPSAKSGEVKDPAEIAPLAKTAKPGDALRKAVTVAGIVALILALGFAVFLYNRRAAQRAAEEARQIASKREFLQGIELVKALRFGDAALLFDRVLEVRPEYERAKEYRAHCAKELEVWGQLEAARRLAAADRHAEALEHLDTIKVETGYAQVIEDRRAEYARAIAEGMLREARVKLDAGDLDAALDLAVAALSQSPSLAAAQELRDEIEDARRDRDKPKPKKKDEIPPEMLRAVALYKNEQLGAAIDAAEAAGGSNAPNYVARMKRVKALVQDADAAHKKKAAAELLRIAPAALELDQQISLGDGKVRSKLKRYYADGLYLKGIEAYAEKDFVRAYQLLSDALKQQPGHALSESRLGELSRKARDMYYEGYVLKDSNAAETRKIFKRLTQMTKPDNQYHKLAAKWLAANGG